MGRFILKRTAYGLITLFLIITATFFLISAAPGDPIAAKVEVMPERAQEVIRAKYGLDQPTYQRYFIYMKNLITTGDFGESVIYTGRSVNDIIRDNAPISAKIGIIALFFQITLGVLLGMIAALNRDKFSDHFIRVSVVLAICVPSFVFAALLQYFIGFKWGITPIFGWGSFKHYILPVAVYAIGGIASYAKFMRNSTLSVMNEDYVLTARAKGCRRARTVRKHIFRNSLIPIVTMTGPAIAGIFAGSFIIERLFSIPGLGQYYVKAVSDTDYTMVLGLTIFFAILYVIALILVDILYGVVDPRIKIAKGE
ncbi:ABC transporter permease [Alkaliphilus peptidifermentans]|uniref:Oligopeptide transport system permease protein n=1 Tax=Alkaliphilus peptidifermentans DSM 18978 TaxID=1120976 RepID=A0A1G5L1L4_9FIRM|nr:ABC transporter permease [Alkaliphilus peptidifermentans]SCZ06772.1 oligopeptide transport system permease protein [Alkaliphilus peptidifermentans DSM 18978]